MQPWKRTQHQQPLAPHPQKLAKHKIPPIWPLSTTTKTGFSEGNATAESYITNDHQGRIQPKIINLSRKNLNPSEIEILRKGLKFTPTPKQNSLQLKLEVDRFERTMRLAEFFLDTKTFQCLPCEKSQLLYPQTRMRQRTGYLPQQHQDARTKHQQSPTKNL